MPLQEETTQQCPYCGEPISLFIDRSAGAQSYYEDCAVCCAPMLIVTSDDDDGTMRVEVRRDDE